MFRFSLLLVVAMTSSAAAVELPKELEALKQLAEKDKFTAEEKKVMNEAVNFSVRVLTVVSQVINKGGISNGSLNYSSRGDAYREAKDRAASPPASSEMQPFQMLAIERSALLLDARSGRTWVFEPEKRKWVAVQSLPILDIETEKKQSEAQPVEKK